MAQSNIQRMGAGPNGETPVIVHSMRVTAIRATADMYGAGIRPKFWVLVVV